MARRKGMRKRHASLFKPGHQQLGRRHRDGSTDQCGSQKAAPTSAQGNNSFGYKRLSPEQHQRTISPPLKNSGEWFSTATAGNTMLLRPHRQKSGVLGQLNYSERGHPHCPEEVSGYRLVHLGTIVRELQEAVKAHRNNSNDCDGLLIPLAKYEVKRGTGVEEVFGCRKCNFKSQQRPLFQEIVQNHKPGRNPCESNVALQLACHNTSLSTTGARKFLSCMNLPAPSASGMQKAANLFGPKMELENERDMASKRQLVKETLKLRGFDAETPIHAEMDRQYNNPLYSSRKNTPFAPATQSRDVVAENVTRDKFVITFNHTNKLCSAGQLRRSRGEEIQCPGHPDCTANVGEGSNIGDEETGGMTCAAKLLHGDHPLRIKYLTTDADGKACKGLQQTMSSATLQSTENLLDETHLNRSLCRAVTQANFTTDMFSAAKGAKSKRLLQKRFAEDVSYRVQAEITACRKKNKFKTSIAFDRAIRSCIENMTKCYSGNHWECSKKSFVCHAKKRYRFPFMPKGIRGLLQIEGANKIELQRILQKRISTRILQATRFGTSTQKCESVNSSFKTVNPKHTANFTRNGRYRDHSAIHMINNGPGESIAMKMVACGLPLSPNDAAATTLRQLQRVFTSNKARKRSMQYKRRRSGLRKQRYRLHNKLMFGEGAINHPSGYCKDQIIHQLSQQDHNYATTSGIH